MLIIRFSLFASLLLALSPARALAEPAQATFPNLPASAATVEGAVGHGWVILCGFHPEAPESWRRGMDFATPVSSSTAYALALIEAALDHRELPHY